MTTNLILDEDSLTRRLFWELPESPTQARILLAEDQSDLRELLAHRLRSLGYEVIEAADGLEMLEEFADWEPDLVIAGTQLRPLTGLEALSRLRKLDQTTPFILINDQPDPDVHAEATRLGAAYVYNRPLDVQHLIGSIWSILGP